MNSEEKTALAKKLRELGLNSALTLGSVIETLEAPEALTPAEAVAELNMMDSLHDSASLHKRADAILVAALRGAQLGYVADAYRAASERCNFSCYCAYDE